MGKKPKWFGAVKKVFSPESKDEKLRRRLATTSSAPNPLDLTPSISLEANVSVSPALTLPPTDTEEVKLPLPVTEEEQEQEQEQQHEQREHVAAATEELPAAAPEAAIVASSRMSSFHSQ